MKKTTAVVLAALCAASAWAKTEYTTNGLIKVGNHTMKPEELRAKLQRSQLKRTGGIIREANSAKGVFVVLNAQKLIPTEKLRTIEPMIDKWLRVQTAFKDSQPVTPETVRSAVRSNGAVLGAAIVESDALPAFLVAPEDGWAIVNAAKLATDKPTEEVLASRIRKEILRGLAFVAGGAYATKADTLMRDVKSLDDLDGLRNEEFGLEIVSLLLKSSSFYGLKPWNQATYKQACQEGWAPQPTNEFQKAIWDQVHSIPTKPIKIEYDPKTDTK